MPNLMAELASLGKRPPGTITGQEISLWWRLAYPFGEYLTETFEHSSICFSKPGASWLQLITSVQTEEGSGIIAVPLMPGDRPIFYRIRSMDMGQGVPGSKCQAIIYGKGIEESTKYSIKLWCVVPGLPGYKNPVPERWVDHGMIELQVSTYG